MASPTNNNKPPKKYKINREKKKKKTRLVTFTNTNDLKQVAAIT